MKQYVLEITPQSCGHLFSKYGEVTTDDSLIYTPEKVALVVFTGGSDVDPSLYNENHGKYTSSQPKRDEYEKKIFNLALAANIPMVGICRGSQFLCVMSGGKLVQDVRNHSGWHKIKTHDERVITCNSTHHQMQLPPKSAKILAYAFPKLSPNHYLNGDNKKIDVQFETEVAYYPNINAVGIQYHPEWLSERNPNERDCVLYAKQVVQEYLFDKEKPERLAITG
mgnify:CR=1 FL=1